MATKRKIKGDSGVQPIRKKLVRDQAADALREYLKPRQHVFFKFPPITELARQLGISMVNVQRAMVALQAEGLVEVIHGKGVFTRPPTDRCIEPVQGPSIGVVCYSERVAMDFLQGRNAFYSIVLHGAMQEAGSRGYQVLMHWIPSDIMQNPGLWTDIRRFSVQNKLAGLLLLCLTEEALVRWIADQVSPCILIDHWCAGSLIDTVNPDNRGAAYAGTRQLLEAGHRDIAYIFHRKPGMNPPRLEGYRAALRDAGLPVREELIVLEDLSEAGGERGVQALERQGVEYSALMTFDRMQARGALRAFRERGQEKDIVTFGSGRTQEDPRITAIDLQPEQVGKLAVDRLLARIQNPALAPEDLTAPAKVIVPATAVIAGEQRDEARRRR